MYRRFLIDLGINGNIPEQRDTGARQAQKTGNRFLLNNMGTVWLRFYEELNDFLPVAKRKYSFPYTYKGNTTVKDAAEASGVPHAEIDMILVNGQSVDFSYKLRDGDNISVYPVFESLDISPVTHLRSKPLRNLKFVLDVHLGKLARYLRLLGLDTIYERDYDDNHIINVSLSDNRIILTCDRGILKNNKVMRGHWIRSRDPSVQVREVIARFDLTKNLKPFTRCLECNTQIISINKEDVSESLPGRTRLYYTDFRKCPGCGRIYWEGSHFERMKKFVREIVNGEKMDYI